MAFVRERKKKGNTYYELVKSVREGDKVKQKFLEYLGSETQAREFCREREDIYFPGPEKKPLDKQIKEKKEELNSLRSLPKEKKKKLEDELEIDWIYNSNAIEGNTLTRKETRKRIFDNETIKGKPVKDQREADNHLLAIHLCQKFAKSKEEISEDMIKRLQGTLTAGTIEERFVGEYRDISVRIEGAPEIDLADPEEVESKMEEFVNYVNENHDNLSPVKLATETHNRLVTIHPFADGNGRTARSLMNIILMKNDYSPIVIERSKREEYIDYIQKDQLEDKKTFFRTFVKEHVRDSLDRYLEVAKE